ncbi:MAG TPA: hypothetical protein VMZ04_08180, partial [Anaerolineae bacterium]|nr:hypothetical protein [Anaerolineae bacterium]
YSLRLSHSSLAYYNKHFLLSSTPSSNSSFIGSPYFAISATPALNIPLSNVWSTACADIPRRRPISHVDKW